jgi:hypothetical protein
MNKNDLSQLYSLNGEIDELERKIEELRTFAEGCAVSVAGLPHISRIADRTAVAADIADLETMLEEKRRQTVEEYARLIQYINTIGNSLNRRILNLRYVDGMSWRQIAQRIGGNTADSIRMIHNRFLESMGGGGT